MMLLKTFTLKMVPRYLQSQSLIKIRRLKKVKIVGSTLTMHWFANLVRKVFMKKVV